MLFNSLEYFVFLLLLLPLYFNSSEKIQRVLLFVFSFYFYAALKLIFVPLLFLSFFATFYTSERIAANVSIFKKKIWLLVSLFANLGMLGFFKYTDFFRLAGYDLKHLLGLSTQEFSPLNLVLPLGISFYTFQAIAYSIDVYRNKIITEKSFFRFSLFLLFFPQLVAGPIMRAEDLLPQFEGLKKFKIENLNFGITLIALGFFKKTIIADPIGDIIKPIYANPSDYSGFANILAAMLFALQIYCDFAGYSDIAIGTGRVLGFNIPTNFLRPFLATSITDLWKRWHISLSTWLRDYVFISLGGSRVNLFRNYFNIFITMVVGGFWHGANWTFVAWGALNGIFLSLEKFIDDRGWGKPFDKIPRPIKPIYSFMVFLLGAIFFRSETISKSFISFGKIFTLGDGKFTTELLSLSIWIPISILIFIEITEEARIQNTLLEKMNWQLFKTPVFIALFVVYLMIYTVVSSPQFYYFQF